MPEVDPGKTMFSTEQARCLRTYDAIPTGAALATKLSTDGNLPEGQVFRIASRLEAADHHQDAQPGQGRAEHEAG